MPHSVSEEMEPPMEEDVQMAADAAPAENEQESKDGDDVVMEEAEETPEVVPAATTSSAKESKTDTEETLQEKTDVKPDAKPEVKLDDLFADMDSDDEFPTPTSSEVDGGDAASDSAPAPASLGNGEIALKASDPEVLRTFYQRLFPWRYLFQWLNHSPTPSPDFAHREFAYTIVSGGSEAYWRYQAFQTHDQFRKDVTKHIPIRFEIGPVYTTNPRDRKSLRNLSSFKPVSKELCFDIDLTDYDDIRTCCSKTKICGKCWEFMTMAIKVVDVALREDFGFKHIMWVYSGRRGAHAWVCDKKARTMSEQKRRAIAGYFEVLRGGAQSGKKVNLRRPLHPHISRSLDILKTHFQDVLEVQDPWESTEQAEKLLQLLPDRQLNDALRKKWDAAPGRASASKWADIDSVAKTGASKSLDAKALLEAKQDIVLEYTYPRLDIEVSKKLNHLLKSPFVVHPGTGNVCVPIDTENLDDFDPFGVPTIQGLLREIDEWKEGEEDESGKKIEDWEKTSLKPYIQFFGSFVRTLMNDENEGPKVKRERDEAGAMEF